LRRRTPVRAVSGLPIEAQIVDVVEPLIPLIEWFEIDGRCRVSATRT
jgi:hypothetical protein